MATSKTDRLTQAANNLHLNPSCHAAFHRLALHHLRATIDEQGTPPYKLGFPAHLEVSTLTFLQAYGPVVWPAFAARRGHLTTSSTVTASKTRGLMFAKACGLVRGELKAWKAAHHGRKPDAREALLGSPMGRLMLAYLKCLVEADVKVLMEPRQNFETDENVLVQNVIE